MTELFPRGVALGEAFYDRTVERAHLKSNIDHTVHTVIIAPRRFGKTSLMSQVLYETHYPSIWLDLMTVTSPEEIQQKLAEKIGDLIVTLSPLASKLKAIIKKYFQKLKPELVFTVSGLSLKLQAPHQDITELLMELDKFAHDRGERIVIVLDEFQEITRIQTEGTTLQASIRHAAERATNITYLFSGSKHEPLKKLFYGKTNPLYQLCDQMTLDRVSEDDYRVFLMQAAHAKWKQALSSKVIDQILAHTDRYPRYINALCGSLWVSDQLPTVEAVNEQWRIYLLSRKTDIAEDLGQLTLNQKRLLRQLAFEPIDEVYSKEYLGKINLSQSSVQAALTVLLDKGLVVKWEGMYRVLDPTIRDYFQLF